jgi:uncharacterized membrane protein
MFGCFGLAVLTGNVLWAIPGVALALILPMNAIFISKPAQVLMEADLKEVKEGDKRIGDAVVSWCNWQQVRTAASIVALAATLYLLTN